MTGLVVHMCRWIITSTIKGIYTRMTSQVGSSVDYVFGQVTMQVCDIACYTRFPLSLLTGVTRAWSTLCPVCGYKHDTTLSKGKEGSYIRDVRTAQ